MHSLALVARRCCLVLVITTYLIVAVRADCSKDCASCAYHMGQDTEINSLVCTLECDGKLPTAKAWTTCKELLQTAKEDNAPVAEKDQDNDNHLVSKKYGGFMKRYGGFMKKKMDELYHAEPEEESTGGEIIAKKYGGFMKKDFDSETSDLLKELLGTGRDPEYGTYHGSNNETPGEMSKRYGGFMRFYRRSPDTEDEGKELQKRYGGFMRRVGRPEWWQDYQKRYGGFMRRLADSLPSDEDGESYSKEIPEMDKRYGGFMRF